MVMNCCDRPHLRAQSLFVEFCTLQCDVSPTQPREKKNKQTEDDTPNRCACGFGRSVLCKDSFQFSEEPAPPVLLNPPGGEAVDISHCADHPDSKMAYECEFRISENRELCRQPAFRCMCSCTCAAFGDPNAPMQNMPDFLLSPMDLLPLSVDNPSVQNMIPDRCPDYVGEDTGRTCLWMVSRLGKGACTGVNRRMCPCTCRAKEEDDLCPDAPWSGLSRECQLRATMGQCDHVMTRERCPCTCAYMPICPHRPATSRPLAFNPDNYPMPEMPVQGNQPVQNQPPVVPQQRQRQGNGPNPAVPGVPARSPTPSQVCRDAAPPFVCRASHCDRVAPFCLRTCNRCPPGSVGPDGLVLVSESAESEGELQFASCSFSISTEVSFPMSRLLPPPSQL